LAIGKVEPDDRIEVVHEEIDRLPEKLRSPLVLCCLEELTYQQAARLLGVNEPTLRGRLHRGRQRLKARLQGRGVSGGAILLLDAPATRLLVPVSHALFEATVQLASKWFALGVLVIGSGSPEVHLLVQGAIRTMIWNSVKTAAIPALIAASVLGTAVLAKQGRDSGRAPGGAGSQAAPSKPSSGSDSSPQKKQPRDGRQQVLNALDMQELKALKQLQRQKMTAHIRELLARESNLDFPNGVSLDQFLKAVKSATSSKDDPGIPIYVDPAGLQEVAKTLESRVVVTHGHTLADVLQRALTEIKLGYVVDDGYLMIDSRLGTVESRLTRVEEKLDRLISELEKKGSRP
jgi:hypothetical protein